MSFLEADKMRVMVIGLRSFPDVQGGVERHAEQLYPLVVQRGCEVEVVVRSPSHPRDKALTWRGVRFFRVWAPTVPGLEALVHSFLGTLVAAVRRPDILHIHAVGPSLMAPLARLLGLRVVVTHHGPDYEREKWGRFARWILRLGERSGMAFANERIVISDVTRKRVAARNGCKAVLIPNGVRVPNLSTSQATLCKFGLAPGRYVLQVSRFVPEKRQLDLMRAFAAARLTGWHLVLVGELNERDAYHRQVIDLAQGDPRVVLAGFQTGRALEELYSHAGLFVLPSSYEGLPIALLEALSYGLPVLASDIQANTEIGLPPGQYFPLGDTAALAAAIVARVHEPFGEAVRRRTRAWVGEKYDWDAIAQQTLAVYRRAASWVSDPGAGPGSPASGTSSPKEEGRNVA